MALAGIWTPAHGAPPTMAILTTGANAALRQLHHRMPVILTSADWDRWLEADVDGGLVGDLLRPAPDDAIRIWPVSTTVNRADNEGPELLAPVVPQPTLGLL
jgi:putative SOS response-associated peptidase YedK